MDSTVEVTTFPMIVGSETLPGSSGKFVDVYNPSTEELIGRVPAATAEEVDLAVRIGVEAFPTVVLRGDAVLLEGF